MANNLNEQLHELGHHLKIRFRLPPNRPTSSEVIEIIKAVEKLPKAQRTESAWREIVYEHVEFTGDYAYEGLDHSDLNGLQAQLMLLLG